MVPFAEVILLTAMEYNREDKKKKKGKKTKKRKTKNLETASLTEAPMDKNVSIKEDKPGHLGLNCGVRSLKMLGEFCLTCLQTGTL